MKNRIAVCPGSFDPVTKGHVDIISRAAMMFSKVIVVVMTNDYKKPCFSDEERVEFINKSIEHLPNVEVDSYSGLLAEYVRDKNAVIVKGLRAMSDFEYEFQMALTNKRLNEKAETVFLASSVENMYLSSSMVKSIASMNGDVSDFVPACIHEEIIKRLNKKGV